MFIIGIITFVVIFLACISIVSEAIRERSLYLFTLWFLLCAVNGWIAYSLALM